MNKGQKLHDIFRGVIAIVCAMFVLSFGDAIIKSVSSSFPLWQLYVLRSAMALPLLFIIIKARQPELVLIPLSIKWTLLRSLLLTGMGVFYYAALPKLEFSVAASALYTLPIFIMIFSAFQTKETISQIGIFAIILGFVGVLVLMRPNVDDFNLYILLPILSAIFYALAMVITRTKCKAESPYVLTWVLNIVFVSVGIIITLCILGAELDSQFVARNRFILGDWIALRFPQIIAICFLAVSMLIGNILIAYAYQIAPPPTVAAFENSYLFFAAMWGILLFSETPDRWTVLGIAMIACAGFLALRSTAHD